MSKDEAFADASTIADLSSWTITWVDAGDLAGIGHPEAVGLTDAFTNTIWVCEGYPSMLIHEALHVAHPGQSQHCGWGLRFKSVHEFFDIHGSFVDECAHLRCHRSGDHAWSCEPG